MYGTNAELAAQNIDTKVLLGLIKEEEEDDVEDEFTYEEEGKTIAMHIDFASMYCL